MRAFCLAANVHFATGALLHDVPVETLTVVRANVILALVLALVVAETLVDIVTRYAIVGKDETRITTARERAQRILASMLT